MWLGIKTFSKRPWRWSKCLLVVMAAEGGEGVAADWCPLSALCSGMNLGWQVNELNVDTLTHPSIYLPHLISPSLPLFSLWRMLCQQQQMKNDSSKSMMSYSNFLRRITGQCRGTPPPFGGLRNCQITDTNSCCAFTLVVSVHVKTKRFRSATLHWIEWFNRSQQTVMLVMMNWISWPLWRHPNSNL